MHPPAPTRPQVSNDADAVESSEAQLLSRMLAGEELAYDDLVRLAGGRMLAVARRMLRNEDDASEAVQEAFLNAFRSLDRFDRRSRLTTWLHRITVNACLMRLRTRRRKPERSIETLLPRFLDDGHQAEPAGMWKPLASAGIESAEIRALVRGKIEELPEPYREIILLRDIAQLDTEQSASLLNITTAGVKTRLHRARQALKALLDPHFAQDAS